MDSEELGGLGMGSEARNMCKQECKSKDELAFYGVDGVDSGADAKEEIKALLLTSRGGVGVGNDDDEKKSAKRKVQWNDEKGNKLVEVVEFEPSEASDSENDDPFDSCICSLM